MAHLPLKTKLMIIEKALNKNQSINKIASIHNIGCSTLEGWLRLYREGKFDLKKTTTKPAVTKLTAAERFNHLLATSRLDEPKLGAYCREHGLYSFQLQEWKKEFMTQEQTKKNHDHQTTELKTLKTENRLLKKNLRRKDMALAETTALLVLKKADLIWGVEEDD